MPLLLLFLNANELDFKNNNIIFSQKNERSCRIPFKDLLLEGLGSHPSIAMSKELIKGAKYRVDTAEWGYYPIPSFDYSFRNADKNQATARLDQPLWTGGKLDAAYDSAMAKKNEASYGYKENQYKLIENYLNTLQSYIQAQRKIEVLKENKEQYNELLNMLNRMIQAGVASQIDRDLLYSRLSRLDTNLVITRSELNVARIKFEILTNRPIPCSVVYTHKRIFPNTLEIENLINNLYNFHPSLKIIDAQVDAAKAEVDSTKSKLWPTIVLRGEYRSSGGLYNDGIIPTSESLVYVTFNVSPGSGLSLLSTVNEAKINVAKIKYDKNIKEKEFTDILMDDYISYITAENRLAIGKQNIVTLEKIYASNKRLYLSQKKEWLDLVNSLAALTQQKIIFTKQSIEYKVFEYKIALRTGKIDLNNGDIIDGI